MEENELEYSKHVQKRIEERELKKEWIEDTLKNPDQKVIQSPYEVHFFKKIIEFAGKCLKVVFNPLKNVVVTAHFDRNKTKKNSNENNL